MSIIELQNVTKLYGLVIGVNDITLSLAQAHTDYWGRTGQANPRS